jgi:hypothetical protein
MHCLVLSCCEHRHENLGFLNIWKEFLYQVKIYVAYDTWSIPHCVLISQFIKCLHLMWIFECGKRTKNISIIFIPNKPHRGKIVNVAILRLEIMQNVWEKVLEVKKVRLVTRTKHKNIVAYARICEARGATEFCFKMIKRCTVTFHRKLCKFIKEIFW